MQISAMWFLYFLSLLTFTYLLCVVVYLGVLAIAGHFNRITYTENVDSNRTYLILIPAYKEDTVILDSVRAALQLNYPPQLFSVVVIADKLQPTTILNIQQAGAQAIAVKFEKSTKSKSLRYALEKIAQSGKIFDKTLILDADNIIAPNCLGKMNSAFDAGFAAVQLHRTAKNKNTPIAYLDAISEEINNHIYRQGMRSVGGSSALIGSGMAFDFNFLNSILFSGELDDNPGEDREIEIRLLKDRGICEYINDGYVFDEKVQNTAVMKTQRQRWISAQLRYLQQFFITDFRLIFITNFHYFIKGFQNLIPPRLLLFFIVNAFLILSLLVHFIFPGITIVPWTYWLSLAICLTIVLLISVPKYLYTQDLLKAILHLPSSLLAMLTAMFKSKFKQKEFVHTVKTYNKSNS